MRDKEKDQLLQHCAGTPQDSLGMDGNHLGITYNWVASELRASQTRSFSHFVGDLWVAVGFHHKGMA